MQWNRIILISITDPIIKSSLGKLLAKLFLRQLRSDNIRDQFHLKKISLNIREREVRAIKHTKALRFRLCMCEFHLDDNLRIFLAKLARCMNLARYRRRRVHIKNAHLYKTLIVGFLAF